MNKSQAPLNNVFPNEMTCMLNKLWINVVWPFLRLTDASKLVPQIPAMVPSFCNWTKVFPFLNLEWIATAWSWSRVGLVWM